MPFVERVPNYRKCLGTLPARDTAPEFLTKMQLATATNKKVDGGRMFIDVHINDVN